MSNQDLMKKFKCVAKKWGKIEKEPHDFGGQIVYHSEVFTLMYIAQNSDISITALAKLMELSKESVSEVVKKLIKKVLVIKNIAPDNASKYILKISPNGEKIIKIHDKIHEETDSNFKKYYDSLNSEKTEIIYEFLSTLDNFLTEVKEKEAQT